MHRLPASLSLQPSPSKTIPRHMFHSCPNISQKTAKRQYSSITSQRFRFQSMAMAPSSHTQTSRPGRPKQQTIGSFPAHVKPLLPLQIVVISPQPCSAGTTALSRWSARWQYMFSRRLRLAFRQEALASPRKLQWRAQRPRGKPWRKMLSVTLQPVTRPSTLRCQIYAWRLR